MTKVAFIEWVRRRLAPRLRLGDIGLLDNLPAHKRRGVEVHATEGEAKVHWNDHPVRTGYGASTPLPFYNEVED